MVEAPGIEPALSTKHSTTLDNARVHPAGNVAGSQTAEGGEGSLSTTGVSTRGQSVSSVSDVIDEALRALDDGDVQKARRLLSEFHLRSEA